MPELNTPKNDHVPEIDQAEIDREIEALLADTGDKPDSAVPNKPAEKKEDYIAQAAAVDLTLGSRGITDDPPASSSSKVYAARHPLAMLLTLLVAAGGIAAIFFVSLKVGTCIILASLFLHLGCLAFLDKKKVKLLFLVTGVILGLVIYFSLPKTKCCDGTYSYSTGSGTCSYHGGIDKGSCETRATCCDGTYTDSEGPGACSHHGGLAKNGQCKTKQSH